MNINQEQLKRDYATFTGRLGLAMYRKQFVILFVISLIINVIATMIASSIISLIAFIISIPIAIGMFSITIRRLHDIGQTGWLSLLLFIPLVNLALIIYLLIAESSVTPNKYGI